MDVKEYSPKTRKALCDFYYLCERGERHTPWGEAAARKVGRLVSHEANVRKWREFYKEIDREIAAEKEAAKKATEVKQ